MKNPKDYPSTIPYEQFVGDLPHPPYQQDDQDQRNKRKHRHRIGPVEPTENLIDDLPDSAHGGSMLKTALRFFLPPLGEEPESVRRWRIVVGCSSLLFSIHVLAAYGALESIGFNGFAYGSSVREIKIEILEERLFTSRVRQCTAVTVESRQFYAGKVQELLRKYEEEVKRPYPRLPTCEEVK